MTNESATMVAITRDVFPDECLLIDDAPLAALAEKLPTVAAPRDALLTIDGGDDLDLQGTFEFLAHAMIVVLALMRMGDQLTKGTSTTQVHQLFKGEEVLASSAKELSNRDLARLIDRVASRDPLVP
jgi:hypothetical protein